MKDKELFGEFIIITDKEDIVVPYEVNFVDNSEKKNLNIDFSNIAPDIFISSKFSELFEIVRLNQCCLKFIKKIILQKKILVDF